MSKREEHISQRTLRTPRSAALSGLIFALLMGASLIMIEISIPEDSTNPADWLENQSGTIKFALGLVPFAGIAFLWFMGVVRDRLGHLEDQFFSTLFFGSGLLYLAMTFGSTAVAGGILSVNAFNPGNLLDSGLYTFSQAMIYKFNQVYALRMAGMHMIVLGTIWTRTQVMPRWVALMTFGLALVLIFLVGFLPLLTLVFPVWVFIISAYVLFLNYRFRKDITYEDGLTLNN
jgi:hypothetical protein